MPRTTVLRWAGRATGAFLVLTVLIDLLTDRFGYQGVLDFPRTKRLEEWLPLLAVGGALGLIYAWHRERFGAGITMACAFAYLAICALVAAPAAHWVPGAALLLPALLLRRAGMGLPRLR